MKSKRKDPNSNNAGVNIANFESPAQMIELVQNPQVRELIVMVTMGQGILEPDGRPTWAIGAAAEFWRCCIDFPKTKRAQSEEYKLGYLLGAFGRYRSERMKEEPAVMSLLNSGQLEQLFHSGAQQAPAPEAAEFYRGFSDGLERGCALSASSPWLVYLIIAARWREAKGFKNTTDIQLWLQRIIGENLTGTRDRISKILQKIRFPLTDKGGRPKNKPRNATAI